MKNLIAATLVMLGTTFAQASNTIMKCSIPNGAYGYFYVEQWHAENITKYSISFERGDGKLIDKGFLSNAIKNENSLTGVIITEDGSISAYLTISKSSGIFFSTGSGPTSNSKGLNPQFAINNCINPQL